MLFRQLFEPDSSTYSYLVSCTNTGETAIIDPVRYVTCLHTSTFTQVLISSDLIP